MTVVQTWQERETKMENGKWKMGLVEMDNSQNILVYWSLLSITKKVFKRSKCGRNKGRTRVNVRHIISLLFPQKRKDYLSERLIVKFVFDCVHRSTAWLNAANQGKKKNRTWKKRMWTEIQQVPLPKTQRLSWPNTLSRRPEKSK